MMGAHHKLVGILAIARNPQTEKFCGQERNRKMTTGEMWGWIGGLGGGIIGLAGGIFGAYCSIKNTNGPRERAFTVKASIVCFIAVLIFMVLLLALPTPYRWFMWIPYAIVLPLGIKYGNRRQQAIRQEESQNRVPVTD
jgi:uncharacterized membrane protein YfcA